MIQIEEKINIKREEKKENGDILTQLLWENNWAGHYIVCKVKCKLDNIYLKD